MSKAFRDSSKILHGDFLLLPDLGESISIICIKVQVYLSSSVIYVTASTNNVIYLV